MYKTIPRSNEPLTHRQQAYLDGLRRGVGLEKWNMFKAILGITTPGTFNLTRQQASRLIVLIRAYLYGGDHYDC